MRVRTSLLVLGLWAAAIPVSAQQTGVVTGTVIDATTREPLEGVQVAVVGTRFGALTDVDGRFQVTGLPPGRHELRVEFIGYTTGEADVTLTTGEIEHVDFALQPRALQLDEVVVTGTAGSARQREVAHAVDEIALETIVEPVASVDDLLEGRIPGVDVRQTSATVGSGSQIRLRGNVSFVLSNQPLVYVDGVRIRSDGYPKNVPPTGDQRRGPNDVPSPVDDISVLDIERVEIVKGPAATTLYGSEAASGVIQIFTRRGSRGAPAWAARVDEGFDEIQEFGTDARPFLGLDPWLRRAWRQRYAASVGGGNDLRYFASGSYDHNEGVLPNDLQERFVGRVNLDYDAARDLTLSWSSSYTMNDLDLTAAGRNGQGLTTNVFRGPRNFLGDDSPEAIDRLLDWDIDTRIGHLITGVTAAWRPSRAMSHRLIVGYDYAHADLRQLRPFGFVLVPEGILSEEEWTSQLFTFDYVGSLDVPLSGELLATVSWGGQNVVTRVTSEQDYAEGFPGPGQERPENGELRLDFLTKSRVTNGGVFGQSVVGWRDRWFLTTGVRLDGNSAFGDELGLQLYPRLGLSWVASDEPWWPRALGRVKLRSAYGHAGRSPGPFDALRTWRDVGLDGEPALQPDKIGNPELGPERTVELEFGVDAAVLSERLALNATLFSRKTTDALFPVIQVPSLGFIGTQLQNVATLRSHGFEVGFDALLVSTTDLAWELGLNVATTRGEADDLGGAAALSLGDDGWIIEGEPFPVMRGAFLTNPHEVAEPVIEADHLFGPNVPTTTMGLLTTLHLPSDIAVSARAEYVGGHVLLDRLARNLAGQGVSPLCAEAYPLLEQGLRHTLTAWERVWCDPEANLDEGPFTPADFFRLRDVSLRIPLPFLPPLRETTLTLSARDFWTLKNDDFLLGHPDMGGSMHDVIRANEDQVPSPATFTLSLQARH